MEYKVGGKILAKKPHACGNSEWLIERTGADVKIKCLKCGKSIFVMVDELKKMTKKYFEGIDG